MEWKGDDWRANRAGFLATGALPLLWYAVLFAVPFCLLLLFSLSEKRGIIGLELTWTLDNYARGLEPLYVQILLKSLAVAGVSTLACLLIGYPMAMGIAFSPRRVKPLLLLVVLLPFWINVVIRTYSLIAVFRTNGFLNDGLEALWNLGDFALELAGSEDGLGERFVPRTILYSDTGVVFGIVYTFLPFMVLPIYATLDRFDRDYLEASLDLGAGHLRTFWSVMLPLSLPGVLSGVIIVFVPALGAFYIPDLLGGSDSVLIGNVIEEQFKGTNNWPFGSALALLLMLITFLLISLRAAVSVRGTAGG